MFDSVGKDPRRRRAAPLLLSVVLNGGAMVALWCWSPPVDASAEPGPVTAIDYVELVAPPGPRAPAAAEAPKAGRPAACRPSVPTAAAPDPSVVPETTAVAAAGDGGGEGGSPEGTGTGTEPSGGGGSPGPALRSVHWSQVQARSRVAPDYPAAARALGFTTTQHCVLGILVDERGVPARVEPRRCAQPFLAPAREAALKWRFYPLEEDGVAVHAQFDLDFRFEPRR